MNLTELSTLLSIPSTLIYVDVHVHVTNLFEKHVRLFCPHSSSQLLPVMKVIIKGNTEQKQKERPENGKEYIWSLICMMEIS